MEKKNKYINLKQIVKIEDKLSIFDEIMFEDYLIVIMHYWLGQSSR
jgi:hypothetical protein